MIFRISPNIASTLITFITMKDPFVRPSESTSHFLTLFLLTTTFALCGWDPGLLPSQGPRGSESAYPSWAPSSQHWREVSKHVFTYDVSYLSSLKYQLGWYRFPLTVGDQTVHSAGSKVTMMTTEITETLISDDHRPHGKTVRRATFRQES